MTVLEPSFLKKHFPENQPGSGHFSFGYFGQIFPSVIDYQICFLQRKNYLKNKFPDKTCIYSQKNSFLSKHLTAYLFLESKLLAKEHFTEMLLSKQWTHFDFCFDLS